jgi:hypothetical protein
MTTDLKKDLQTLTQLTERVAGAWKPVEDGERLRSLLPPNYRTFSWELHLRFNLLTGRQRSRLQQARLRQKEFWAFLLRPRRRLLDWWWEC